jgi:transposase-like protein
MDSLKEDQFKLAIAHLNRQEKLNYAAAARLYGLEPTTLRRRHKGLAVS